MENVNLVPKTKKKAQKSTPYLEFQVKVGVDRDRLMKWAELATQALRSEKVQIPCRPKNQKLFKTNPHTGAEEVDMTGIGRWIRDIVIPDFEAHAWEREQLRAQLLKKEQEIQEQKKKLGMI